MFKNLQETERGQVLILIAVGIIGLLGFVALAVDGGNALMDRRHAQNAADTAALAAAYAKISSQDPNTAALAMAASNAYNNDGVNNTVTLIYPPGAGCKGEIGPYAGDDDYLQVVIHSYKETFFAQVVGIPQVHNCVEAIARTKPSITTEMFEGNAVVALSPHNCQAIDVGGNADTDITGGGVFVNSDCSSGAFRQHGNGNLTAPSTCAVGGVTYKPGNVIPAPTSGCVSKPYPPEIIFPTPSCSAPASKNGNVWSPGNINGGSIGGNIELSEGIYCISGNVSINAQDYIYGVHVLLYFIDGGLRINGGAEVHLQAFEEGNYAGLLMYLPMSNSSEVWINGNSESHFYGSILAPASHIQINGTGSANGFHTQFIGYTVELTGTADTTIFYNDNENYDATIPPSIEIVR